MVRKTPFPQALADQQVSAVLRDVDLYRIHGGMAVETDYIIRVECKRNKGGDSEPSFETFTISKTFSHFRTFAKQLKMLADNAMSAKERKRMKTDEVTKDLLLYCETVHQLIESQRHQYIGKVSKQWICFFSLGNATKQSELFPSFVRSSCLIIVIIINRISVPG